MAAVHFPFPLDPASRRKKADSSMTPGERTAKAEVAMANLRARQEKKRAAKKNNPLMERAK